MSNKPDGYMIYLASEGYFHHLPYEDKRPDNVYNKLRLPGRVAVTDSPHNVGQYAQLSGENIRYLPEGPETHEYLDHWKPLYSHSGILRFPLNPIRTTYIQIFQANYLYLHYWYDKSTGIFGCDNIVTHPPTNSDGQWTKHVLCTAGMPDMTTGFYGNQLFHSVGVDVTEVLEYEWYIKDLLLYVPRLKATMYAGVFREVH